MVDRLVVAGLAGLRWAAAQPLPDDDVYAGAAGVLRALAEAHLGGHRAFDKVALQLRDRLIAAPLGAESGLYVGAAGHVAALTAWAGASGDATAAASAAEHARRLAAGPVPASRDVINGQAGLLLVLVAAGERDSAARVADALAAVAEPAPGGVQWRHTATATYLMPGLSHGTAGVVLALARTAGLLDRPDLLALARAGGQHLLTLGRRDDGTLALPLTVPPQPAPPHQAWGWCHGPTGTVQAFLALAAHDPAWQPAVDAALAALQASGVPERRYPGFWDNVAQCCGTAGVLELALDRYQASTDPDWLAWAGVLADDLLAHAVPVDGADDAALTWSNVEHRRPDPVLPPEPGWMQGTAGIAAALLRTARLRRDGPAAARVPCPTAPDATTTSRLRPESSTCRPAGDRLSDAAESLAVHHETIVELMGVTVDDRLEQTQRLYERAVFGGDASALAEGERHLDAIEADLALARGRVIHARFLEATSRTLEAPDGVADELALFERAIKLYRTLGDVRGEAEAQFWIGTFHQVVRHHDATAVPALERARALATQADDPLTLSYALRHLGIAEHRAGRLDEARSYLEESTRLRRQLGFGPGVAANLVGLAYIAAADGRSDDVSAMLSEADSIAGQSAAAAITRQIDEARQHLTR